MSERPSARFMAISALVVVVYHFALWAMVAESHAISWSALLSHWDSGWYDKIILDGYDGIEWAFYPLYPLLVRIVASLGGAVSSPQFVGTIVSTILFGICVWCFTNSRAEELRPQSRAAWLLFVLSPASFAFHSHHTESLFLLLSLGAFVAAFRGKWWIAAIFAGLCALTRNQGVFLAIGVAILSASRHSSTRERMKVFALSGLVSGAIFGLYPAYQFLTAGDPLLFARTQGAWRAEVSLSSYFRTLWFGNPWQNTNTGSLFRHGLFLVLAASTVFVWRRNRPLGTYVGLSVAIMPLPGEFVGVFRYAAVLFPALFALGDRLSLSPRVAQVAVGVLWLWLNHLQTRNYALLRWCY